MEALIDDADSAAAMICRRHVSALRQLARAAARSSLYG